MIGRIQEGLVQSNFWLFTDRFSML